MDDEVINNLITQYNTVKAQNLAMTHALAAILSVLPDEFRHNVEKHYDLRCSLFQVLQNDGINMPDVLELQREEFSTVRRRIFSPLAA